MRLTKFEHACLMLEEAGERLIIDPGELAKSFVAPNDVVALVITHAHYDHFDPQKVQAILAENPGMPAFGTKEVAAKLPVGIVTVMAAGETSLAGPFRLEFFGQQHAPVNNKDVGENIGVLINDFFYPGDSFVTPGRAISTLALPVSGPWVTPDDPENYLRTVAPAICIPTHDGFLHDTAHAADMMALATTCQSLGIDLRRLDLGDATTI